MSITPGNESNTSRLACATTVLACAIVWQIHVAFTAFRLGQAFAGLYGALGAQLPLPTRLFLISYRWWATVPALFLLLWFELRRGRPHSMWYLVVLIGSALGAAILLATWSTESCLSPMFSLINQIG